MSPGHPFILTGTYCLVVRLDQFAQIRVGALGTFDFLCGWYIYVGSAMGPGGLRARLARHSRSDKRLHWHIDYLLAEGTLEATWQMASSEKHECVWAKAVIGLPGARIPALGFGSSDCRCPSHLVYLPHAPMDRCIRGALTRAIFQSTQDAGIVLQTGHCLTVERQG
ncbi:MAG: GIY-YIG nuclease family protein [Anaerolineae bacterium]|nr:GIY-YIG nuclease family protein [Anaerolineae bacterium]